MAFREKNPFGLAKPYQRLQDRFLLYRLTNWLPRLKKNNPGRYREVLELMSSISGHAISSSPRRSRVESTSSSGAEPGCRFRRFLIGYRGFIGWVGDLLYHLSNACPAGQLLVDLPGVVMVDEIDLLLHPHWQMTVVKTVAKALPRIPTIFTSHSPLVAGSLEWMNINLLKITEKTNKTVVKRLTESIHGLDADQVLISEFFGLSTTRTRDKATKLDALTAKHVTRRRRSRKASDC